MVGVGIIAGAIFVPTTIKTWLAIPALLIVMAGGIAAIAARKLIRGEDESEKTEKKKKPPIIVRVPKNQKMVLRNVWRSNPVTLEGYSEKPEGLQFWLPGVWHSFEGFVDLKPIQIENDPIRINCKDGNDVEVDTRLTCFIRPDNQNDPGNHMNATKFLLNVEEDKTNDLVLQRARVALNTEMNTESVKAIGWTPKKKKNYGDTVTALINQLLSNDDDKDYGLQARVDVENIEPTPALKAARDRQAAAKVELEAAPDEAGAIKEIVDKAGVSPNIAFVTQTIADALRVKKKSGSQPRKEEDKK